MYRLGDRRQDLAEYANQLDAWSQLGRFLELLAIAS
jgi:hypothetical protein